MNLGVKKLSFALLLVLALSAVYWDHFDNSFHFDDAHTIQDNVFIRDLHNIPRFFVDPKTFSALPDHYGYRPILSVSFALDYWLGGQCHLRKQVTSRNSS